MVATPQTTGDRLGTDACRRKIRRDALRATAGVRFDDWRQCRRSDRPLTMATGYGDRPRTRDAGRGDGSPVAVVDDVVTENRRKDIWHARCGYLDNWHIVLVTRVARNRWWTGRRTGIRCAHRCAVTPCVPPRCDWRGRSVDHAYDRAAAGRDRPSPCIITKIAAGQVGDHPQQPRHFMARRSLVEWRRRPRRPWIPWPDRLVCGRVFAPGTAGQPARLETMARQLCVEPATAHRHPHDFTDAGVAVGG